VIVHTETGLRRLLVYPHGGCSVYTKTGSPSGYTRRVEIVADEVVHIIHDNFAFVSLAVFTS